MGTYEEAMKRALERGELDVPENLWGATRLEQTGIRGAVEPDIFDAYNTTIGGESAPVFNRLKGHAPWKPPGERFVQASALKATKVSGLMGKALKFLGHPAVVAGMFAPDAVNILSKLTRAARQAREQDIYVNQLLEVGVEERRRRRDQYAQEQRRGMLRDENARRLAQFAPHLYNQVMAGKKLPRDAVVVGGQPRMDLLDELAQSMADGAWEGS